MEPYQGYVLASNVNADAMDMLVGMFKDGQLRVVVPLVEPQTVFVAAEAVTLDGLQVILQFVAGVVGFENAQLLWVFVGDGAPRSVPPNWVPPTELLEWLGFAVLDCEPGKASEVLLKALEVDGVVAGAQIAAPASVVLVEVTGQTKDVLAEAFDKLGDLDGVATMTTHIGATSEGHFRPPAMPAS